MYEFYFLIFLSIMVLGIISSLVYLNFEIVLIIIIIIILYSIFYTDSNKNTKTKEQQQTINKTIKDLDVKNTREKNLSKTYVIEYFNENEFRKKERGIKKYNMLAYKKLMFEYYPSLREGNFSGVVVSKNDQEQIFKYELKLPTDSTFSKVYEDIVLHYTVYENQKIVMLNNITPDDILTEGHQKELSTYKGVPISKSHAEKDMFKINLLNMLGK